MVETSQTCQLYNCGSHGPSIPFTGHAKCKYTHTALHSEVAVWTLNTLTDRGSKQQLSLAREQEYISCTTLDALLPSSSLK